MNSKKISNKYDYTGMSAFCLQTSLLLDAAIPLPYGLEIMADDAASDWEKEMLMRLSTNTNQGMTLAEALEQEGNWPNYIVKMCKVGQETGKLDVILKSVSEYCDRLDRIKENIKKAVTYPFMMIIMLLIVLYVLFSHVMPIFQNVYEQMGAQLSPITITTMKIGRVASASALILIVLLMIVFMISYISSKYGYNLGIVRGAIGFAKRHMKTAKAMYKSEFASVLAMTIQSGLTMDRGFELTQELIEDEDIKKVIGECIEKINIGENYYDILKNSKLFSGFHLQMIKVGSESGHLDTIMEVIAKDYEEKMNNNIERWISGFEPTVVGILAVCVGTVLLSVMIPLVGLLSSIG